MEPSHSQPDERLNGIVDRFVSPRTLAGWVVNTRRTGFGRDITLTVRQDGRIIGQGGVEFRRPDIVDQAGYVTGFRVICTEDIPDAAIAFETVTIEARNETGSTARVGIYDVERGKALTRLFRASPPLGKSSGEALLSLLATCRAFDEALQAALQDLQAKYFPSELDIAEAKLAEAQAAPPAEAETQAAADISLKDLMFQFENLGKDCVLGGIQRSYGAEPLGLLRFAGIGVDQLTTALRDRFRGVGEPEFTRLITNPEKEYFSQDTRYHMSAHTFIFEGQFDFDQLFKRQCKKIAFLARNLIEKVEEGEKIFVIHNIPGVIEEPKLQLLYESLRALGPATLLYVEESNDQHPPGSARWREDGILAGYVLRPSDDLMNPAQAAKDSWVAVCRAAYAMKAGR